MKTFVIVSTSEVNEEDKPLYWSNNAGWVDLCNADEFSKKERNSLNLPIDGKWAELKNFDVTFSLTIYNTITVEAPTREAAKANAESYHNIDSDEFPFDPNDLVNDWKERAIICGITSSPD